MEPWSGSIGERPAPRFGQFLESGGTERGRYDTLRRNLSEYRVLLEGKRVLDFGASYGLSACALMELGAGSVVGVEPDRQRVERGAVIVARMQLHSRIRLLRLEDTSNLPFADGYFGVVLANAVLEHIPQPRAKYIREMWRVLSPGGHLIVSETPNKYLPVDFHTTGGLWLLPWLPRSLARHYAIWRGRWDDRRDWASSGWRGLGYYELTRPLRTFKLLPESSRFRHRVLTALGLPASLFDPYPTWILQKQ